MASRHYAETSPFRRAARKFGLVSALVWQNRLDFRRIVRIALCVQPVGSATRRAAQGSPRDLRGFLNQDEIVLGHGLA
jgi:hypothetical protein